MPRKQSAPSRAHWRHAALLHTPSDISGELLKPMQLNPNGAAHPIRQSRPDKPIAYVMHGCFGGGGGLPVGSCKVTKYHITAYHHIVQGSLTEAGEQTISHIVRDLCMVRNSPNTKKICKGAF